MELQIQGMTCGHCVRAVTGAVRSVDPAAKVEVDLPTGRAKVQTTGSADAIKASLIEEGYPTVVLTA